MALFENQILTDVGHDALSVALGGGTLTFYKLQAGSGRMADDNDDNELRIKTELIAPETDIPITNYRIDGRGQITLIGVLASDVLDAGFQLTEIGVFACIEPASPFGGTPAIAVDQNLIVRTGDYSEGHGTPIDPPPIVGPFDVVMYSICNAGPLGDYIPGIPDAGSTEVVNTIEVTIVID